MFNAIYVVIMLGVESVNNIIVKSFSSNCVITGNPAKVIRILYDNG